VSGGAGEPSRRILYVTHTSIVSGAEQALLELLRGLPTRITPHVLCPPGELADLLSREGVSVAHMRGMAASLRLSPVHTVRGLWQLAVSALEVRAAARRSNAGIVHANSIRAGLIAVVAALLGGPPVVVHIHDVLPDHWVTRLVRRVLRTRATALIAVSHYGREKFLSSSLPPRCPFPVLYNPVDVDRFVPSALSRDESRRRLGTAPNGPLLGIVAQITPWKGHDTAVRALARLRTSHPTARLVCVGQAKFVGAGTRFDNPAFEKRLKGLIRELQLDDAVEFWGQRDDVSAILPALDALLVPSWEEPLGRTMLEAMASGTPVVATTIGGPAEVIEPGVTGFLAPPRDPGAWADILGRALEDPARLEAVAEAGRASVVERFDSGRYVREVLRLYEQLLAERAKQ
jgi:glycosyltransferase involved in cell wall biosynthesis